MTSARLPLALALLVAACAAPAPQPAPGLTQLSPPAAGASPEATITCAGSGDSATLSAERGIGGTGVAESFAGQGIGGTGIGGTGIGSGIGGTGIGSGIGGTGGPTVKVHGPVAGIAPAGGTAVIGPIAGFAGLCVNGVAVAVDGPIAMTVDGMPRESDTVSLGQVAAIEARGVPANLHAVSVALRHEVSGPITAVGPDGGIEVVGQRVAIGPQTRRPAGLRPGDWVAVSGLRDLTGTIQASRIDPRVPGITVVSGRPRRAGDAWTLGALVLRFPAGQAPAGDGRLLMTGSYEGGVLRVETTSDDPVLPGAIAARHFILRSFAAVDGAVVHLTGGVQAAVGPDFAATRPPADRPVVVDLAADPQRGLIAQSWHAEDTP